MLRNAWYWSLALLSGMGLESLGAEPAKAPAPGRISSKVVVEPSAPLSDKDSRELSFAAGRVLKHVAQARTALAEDKNDQALVHVDQGLKLMAIIDGVLPRYKMKTTIDSGELAYSDEDEFSPEFITIFEELDRRDIASPVLRAKTEAAQKTSTQPAGSDASPAKGAMYFSQADIDYTSLRLDVDLSRRLLREAKKSLVDADPKQADVALSNLQAMAVLLEYDEIDLPLAQAADNLKLAETEMKAGRFEMAKAALNAASDELEKYEKQTGETPQQGSEGAPQGNPATDGGARAGQAIGRGCPTARIAHFRLVGAGHEMVQEPVTSADRRRSVAAVVLFCSRFASTVEVSEHAFGDCGLALRAGAECAAPRRPGGRFRRSYYRMSATAEPSTRRRIA